VIVVLMVCFFVLVGRLILIRYKTIQPIQLSSMACLAYPKLFAAFSCFIQFCALVALQYVKMKMPGSTSSMKMILYRKR